MFKTQQATSKFEHLLRHHLKTVQIQSMQRHTYPSVELVPILSMLPLTLTPALLHLTARAQATEQPTPKYALVLR